MVAETRLGIEDLVRDEPLAVIAGGEITAEHDSLNHRVVARRVAELVSVSAGHSNVALFGPWGSGKSSFYGLMQQELRQFDPTVEVLHFDAWKNAGQGFQANFLSEISLQLSGKEGTSDIKLFTTQRSVRLPFGLGDRVRSTRWWIGAVLLALLVFLVPPLVWTSIVFDPSAGTTWFQQALAKTTTWFGFVAGSALLVAVVMMIMELSKVTVEESRPSHVAQFSRIFNEILQRPPRAGGRGKKFVIFVDELDRCSSDDVMRTLEGLRTFLGHAKCVFVVAFDRDAVALTIKRHLEQDRAVPSRPERPYYSTAGEYLDKIFQFQVSLPPQPPHTFRKYAASLVDGRSQGVWAGLPAEIRARVIAILSPVHVTSPRRTKILLNDFAINVRVFESLGFDWVARAEEIAALTVIQTEFPRLAADNEREPGLLPALAASTEPERADLRTMYSQYVQDDGAVVLDEIVGTDSATETSDLVQAGAPRAAQGVADQLHSNLKRFLRTLNEMHCQIPRADLVLMHSGDHLLAFEDVRVYNTMVLAGDLPLDDVIEALEGISRTDATEAIAYLLEHIEGEISVVKTRYIAIVGVLAKEMDAAQLATTARTVHGHWLSLTGSQADATSRLPARSREGVARLLALAGESDAIHDFYESIADIAPDSRGQVLSALIASSAGRSDPHLSAYLGGQAVGLFAEDSDPLRAYIRTRDADESSLTNMLAEQLGELIAPKPLTEPAPAASAAARREAAAAHAKAEADREVAIERERNALQELVDELPHLSADGVGRDWIFRVLRLSLIDDWAANLHDSAVLSERSRGYGTIANDLLLKAIAVGPAARAAGWAEQLDSTSSADDTDVEAALLALYSRLGEDGADDGSRSVVVTAADAIVEIVRGHRIKIDADKLAPTLQAIAARDWVDGTTSLLLAARRAMRQLASVSPNAERDVSLASDLLCGFAESTADLNELGEVERELTSESVDLLHALALRGREWMRLEPDHDVTAMVRLVLAAHSILLQRGKTPELLGSAEVERVNDPEGNGTHLRHWITTGPPLAEIARVADALPGIDEVRASDWRVWAGRVDSSQATAAWKWLRARGSSDKVLTAVASNGVDPALYQELVEAVAGESTHPRRATANGAFRTLPSSPAAARASVYLAAELAKPMNKIDAGMAASNLLAVRAHLTSSEKSRMRRILEPWIEASTSVSKRTVADLRDAGLLPQKKSWIMKRLGLSD
ncbi:P-loop NTPase fold protein [Microbacterium sp. C7(2022)]|uniref:KAP family P-loop NTPase fold protein n=1 Tax=Microbacterium sp. C7(2022) TaxID=2992759 RepID=UPI00237BCB7B|nr:P-loop NTPase fold protein [Microbacterium sp. C7(2022)]MDE0545922.1 KAP family NTPase [Microbacterium sp. C7(2022)]